MGKKELCWIHCVVKTLTLFNLKLFHSESLKTEIGRSLQFLTARQKEILCCFFGIGIQIPQSLEEIGKRFNLTAERIRQIKDKALVKLRSRESASMLRSYL
ncbi:MAG: sigma factor-like helix-turn-helix DNA-binding protein [Chitinophagaceae bacterium]